MFNKIDHVEIIPGDFERSMDFYTRVLGFTVRTRETVGRPPLEEVAYLELGGTVVELTRSDSGDGHGPRSDQVGTKVSCRLTTFVRCR